jgi:hypothetical protein
VTAPIALAGITAAHAIANTLFGSPEGPGELFAAGTSGLVPLAAALALLLLLLGLAGRVAGVRWSAVRGRAGTLPFACLSPVVFIALEVVEGLLHRGVVPWHDAPEPTFLVGLLLQLPFALAGYLTARALLRVSDRLRLLIVRRRIPRVATSVLAAPRAEHEPRRAGHQGSPSLGRAPPAARVASA